MSAGWLLRGRSNVVAMELAYVVMLVGERKSGPMCWGRRFLTGGSPCRFRVDLVFYQCRNQSRIAASVCSIALPRLYCVT